jgi:hypothetical protein
MAIDLFGTRVNIHPRFGNNFMDANALDNTGSAEDAATDEILLRAEQRQFTLLLPYSVQAEIAHPKTPAEVKHKAQGLLFSMQVQLTAGELATHEKLRVLIQGNARPGQHAKDAFHIVESAKNGGRHFITNDVRLLKKAPDIWQALQIRVLKPTDFIADYFRESEVLSHQYASL